MTLPLNTPQGAHVNDPSLAQTEQDVQSLLTWAAGLSVKPTVAGSKGGNAALTSLIAALVQLGLIKDSTT